MTVQELREKLAHFNPDAEVEVELAGVGWVAAKNVNAEASDSDTKRVIISG